MKEVLVDALAKARSLTGCHRVSAGVQICRRMIACEKVPHFYAPQITSTSLLASFDSMIFCTDCAEHVVLRSEGQAPVSQASNHYVRIHLFNYPMAWLCLVCSTEFGGKSSLSKVLTILAGLPATTLKAGMLFVTTDPAPMTHPLPMETPGNTITEPPNQQSEPTVMGLPISGPFVPFLADGERGWEAA